MEKVIGKLPANLAIGPFFDGAGSVIPNNELDVAADNKRNRALEVCFQLSNIFIQDVINPTDALFLDFCKQLLLFDPEKRLTAEKALQHPFIQ